MKLMDAIIIFINMVVASAAAFVWGRAYERKHR